VQSQADLLHVVHATSTARRLANFLNGREKQRDQQSDDGDDDEQLHEREAAPMLMMHETPHKSEANAPSGA
jgi:hypothetical protein